MSAVTVMFAPSFLIAARSSLSVETEVCAQAPCAIAIKVATINKVFAFILFLVFVLK
jgi:hypothetical protein